MTAWICGQDVTYVLSRSNVYAYGTCTVTRSQAVARIDDRTASVTADCSDYC